MNYSPKIWTGTFFGQIFSEAIYANNTVDKALVRVLDNIKYKQNVTSLTGDLVVQNYAITPTSAGQLTFSDASIEPVKKHVYHEFEMDSLRSTRFSSDMKSGAANMESNEFLKAVLEYAVPRVGKAIEKDFWTLLVTKLQAASDEIAVAGATLTPANIIAEMEKVYAAMPGEILEGSDAKIYAPHAVKQMIKVANLNQTYRDIFTVAGEDIAYLGVPVEFVPLAANTLIAGRSTDLIMGTDLMSDFGQFEVNKVQANSDQMFLKATFSLDAAVCVANQKVLYKA